MQTTIYSVYIYIGSRLGVPRSFEEPSVLMLYHKGRSCIEMGGGGWVGVGVCVITSCEVRWMMLNPGRCCLVGRCCYVASFVVVYRRGVGGVIASCEVRWMMLNPGRLSLVKNS